MKHTRFGLLATLALASLAFADTKIPDLPAGAALGGTDPIPTVQADVTVKTTPAAISTYVESQLTSADVIGKWGGTCSVANFLRGDGNCGLVALTSNVSGVLPVANGGSGAATLTGVLKGNGTGAFTAANVILTSEVTGTLPVANGGTNLTASADDEIPVGNGTTWQSKAVPNCGSSTQALAYNATTNTFSCQTVTGSATSPAGSSGQVQFNNGGVFGASAGFSFAQGSGSSGDNLTLGRTGVEVGRLQGAAGSSSASNSLVVQTQDGPAGFGSGTLTVKTGTGGSSSSNSGDMSVTTGNGGATNGTSGNLTIGTGSTPGNGASGTVDVIVGNSTSGTDGSYRVTTGGTERLEILGAGGWEVGGSQGTSGHVLTSNGSGAAPSWQAGGATQSTGTFDATIATGCSTTPTVGFAWSKIGNIVALKLTANTVSCTSNTTTHTTSGAGDVPAAIRPSSEVTFGAVGVLNNGSQSWGCMSISSAGTIIWEVLQSNICQNNGYTASGSRGVVGTGNQAATTVYTYTIQ